MGLLKLSTITLLVSLSFFTEANFLKSGSFLGTHNGEDKVNLLLKTVPGRSGSFLAILMKTEEKISLYMVDKLNSTSYTMTPLEVTNDGELGVVNDDPSLVISSSQNNKNELVFKIMSANSSNNVGFEGHFEFKNKPSKFSWLEINPGEYKTSSESNALQISEIDSFEKEGLAAFLTKDISGTFTINEKFPGMYLINKNSVLATGVNVNKIPSAIGIFLEKQGFFGGKTTMMILVNPENDSDLKVFTKK